jgi:hypothetical protein
MRFVKATAEYGIIIRKQAMDARGASRDRVLHIFGDQPPHDEDDRFLSMGPCFGEEAGNFLVRSIEALGLTYVDDFFLLTSDVPSWCQLGVSLT